MAIHFSFNTWDIISSKAQFLSQVGVNCQPRIIFRIPITELISTEDAYKPLTNIDTDPLKTHYIVFWHRNGGTSSLLASERQSRKPASARDSRLTFLTQFTWTLHSLVPYPHTFSSLTLLKTALLRTYCMLHVLAL